VRLPCDAALILIDLQQAIDDPRWGPRNNPDAERMIATLLAAWREEGLPIVHVRHDSVEPNSPYRPDRSGHAFKPETAPQGDEAVVGKRTHSAFVGTALEATLDKFGATTLVVCGVLTHNSVEASVRHAADLGYRVFVVADACWAVDLAANEGRAWPAEIVHRLALACLAGEYAEVVEGATALAAARLANARQRRKGKREGEGEGEARG
jgi:nicotinamidase-related amidase